MCPKNLIRDAPTIGNPFAAFFQYKYIIYIFIY
jgi:hypothetical protein